MSKARTSIEKAHVLKEDQNRVVSKASGIVNALLEPAPQAAKFLDGIRAMFPPCKVARNIHVCVPFIAAPVQHRAQAKRTENR